MVLITKYFIFTVSFILLVSCTTTPTGRTQLKLRSDGEMNSMGSQAFSQMKAKVPKELDPKINAYVRCVALKVVNQAKDETGVKSWEVVVFKDKSANAFALPGGKIGVHTGLLKVAKNQDQLAAVLGHEVGHVIARHGNERVSQALLTQGGLIIASVLTGESKNRGLIMASLGLGAQFGVMLPFSRHHESEADEIGQELMAKAGFDPRASVQLWQNMAKAGESKVPEFMSTHPGHSTRIKNLNKKMDRSINIYNSAQAQGNKPHCQL